MDRLCLIGGPETEAFAASEVGGKAANLAAMARMGLPVPPAFVLPIGLCAGILAGERNALAALDRGLMDGLAFLEARTGRIFGDRRRPLLVSVRSGAERSMPGMLETVLDIGATEAGVSGLVRLTGNPRMALDCRRRFLEAYGETVLGIDPRPLASRLSALVAAEGVASDRDLDVDALERHVAACLAHISDAGKSVPPEPAAQLRAAAVAVFRSWNADKAATYRGLHGLQWLAGTAVTVQAMVYGNADSDSAAGVAFSRDPSTGEARQVVEVLFDAQGEDVVSGRRTPEGREGLERRQPTIATRLLAALADLEAAFGDVQDVEFTIESGTLWMLQTRAAKRTPLAALKIAIALVREGRISEAEAASRLAALDEASLVETRFVDGDAEAMGHGLAAAPGVAAGRIACDSAAAQRLAASGDPVILVRPDTATADVAGFAASAAILTATGGRTAHAALVARQMGRPCVVNCAGLTVDETRRMIRIGLAEMREGDWLSLDANSGTVFPGRREIRATRPDAEIAIWKSWDKSETEAGGGRPEAERPALKAPASDPY